MKECNNTDTSDKAQYPPPTGGVGGYNCSQQVEATAYCHVPTQNQQLPIKDKLMRRQVQSLIENYATHTVRAVQYKSAVLVRHFEYLSEKRGLVGPCFETTLYGKEYCCYRR